MAELDSGTDLEDLFWPPEVDFFLDVKEVLVELPFNFLIQGILAHFSGCQQLIFSPIIHISK